MLVFSHIFLSTTSLVNKDVYIWLYHMQNKLYYRLSRRIVTTVAASTCPRSNVSSSVTRECGPNRRHDMSRGEQLTGIPIDGEIRMGIRLNKPFIHEW